MEMFNEVFKEHRDFQTKCPGNLSFDFTTEQQWRLCWREKFVCNRCKNKLPGFSLFKEVDSRKSGRRAASANFGLNVALTQTPIGPSSIRRLCMGSNIPTPSRSSMHTSAGNVCKEIKMINYIDIKRQRNVVKTVNKIRGMHETDIIVQGDRIYNNSLFSGVGKTP